MPVFQYNAIDKQQRRRSGVIASDSPRQARVDLRAEGLRVVEISEADKTRATVSNLSSPFKRNWDHWVTGFAGELATLLSVDVSLVDALATLKQQYNRRGEQIALSLKDSVSSGQSLASAMRQQPEIFDSLCVKMVEVGEQTGNLDTVLRQVADFKQRSVAFKDRVLSALLYPIIILSVSVGVSVFLMTVVVPMLLENLKDSGRPLPWPTLILKGMSDLLTAYGSFLLVFLVLMIAAVWFALQYKPGRMFRDRWVLKIPLVGKMSQKQEISRVALVVATLLKSGIKFVPAIRIAIGTTKNELLLEALQQCANQVESGRDIGISLSENSYFPPLVAQVFTVGQESGKLEPMLFRLSQDYDQQVETVSGRLSTVIEPALILVLSVFIGFIMFATLMPILEAGNVF